MSRSTWTDHAWELLHEAPQPPALHKALGETFPETMRALETRIQAFDFEGAEDAADELQTLFRNPGRTPSP